MIRPDERRPNAPRSRPVFLVLAAIAVVVVGTRLVRSSSSAGEVVVASFAIHRSPGDSVAALIAHGERVYQGKAGGALCATCHGPRAKGIAALGPDLTDGEWLHGDGSVGFLRTIIRTGVSKPRTTAAIMPPYGGSPLKADQLEAVATYIHSLSTAGR